MNHIQISVHGGDRRNWAGRRKRRRRSRASGLRPASKPVPLSELLLLVVATAVENQSTSPSNMPNHLSKMAFGLQYMLPSVC